jgi:hypothetical protein
MKLFGRQPIDDDQVSPQARSDARRFLPSSAKSPDAQRLNLFNPDEELDETTDEDLAFLNSLIADSSPAPAPTPAPKAARDPRPTVAPAENRDDDLEVFREIAAMRQKSELARQLRVDDVDIGDLLEDLQTMRAALRHRKAA